MEFLDELAEIVADLRAHIDLEGLRGASAIPVEAVVPVDLGPLVESGKERPARPRAVSPPLSVGDSGAGAERQDSTPPAAPRSERWAALTDRPQPSVEAASGGEGLDQAVSLEQVREIVGDCTRCGLCEGRSQLVFGTGSPDARLLVIGEAPGFHEDRSGEPFVGKAGLMLDRMLENVLGITREQVYITNVVKCRPPENRNPEPEEIARCRPFLLNQIRIIQPRFLLVLGSVACRAVFGPKGGVTRLRGQWQTVEFPGGQVQAMPTFHPAYLLRKPQDKRLSFDDLRALRQAMDSADG